MAGSYGSEYGLSQRQQAIAIVDAMVERGVGVGVGGGGGGGTIGGATAAKQDQQTAAIGGIETKLDTLATAANQATALTRLQGIETRQDTLNDLVSLLSAAPTRFVSLVNSTTNQGAISASPFRIYSWDLDNLTASAIYLQFFGATTSPVNGSVPDESYYLAGNSSRGLSISSYGLVGYDFPSGGSWAVSSTPGVLTLVSGAKNLVIRGVNSATLPA